MPPQVNATLLKIAGAGEGGGTGGDWGHGDAGALVPGATKWEGELPAYYSERVMRTDSSGGTNVDVLRELIIDTGDTADLIDADDVLTWELQLPAGPPITMDGTAREIARHRLAGIPAELQTTRLVLEVA